MIGDVFITFITLCYGKEPYKTKETTHRCVVLLRAPSWA